MAACLAILYNLEKSEAWKIELEPYEKLPMYSATNLSLKLQMENGR